MRCQRVRRLLLLHVGGDLPSRMAERVEVHLDGCEAWEQRHAVREEEEG